MTRVGFIAIGRSTFDVELAQSSAVTAHRAASQVCDVVGVSDVLLQPDAVAAAAGDLGPVDALVILLATFTDATLPGVAAEAVGDVPIVLWGIPEARTGSRLRLNSLCGINLAAYRLVGGGVDLRWLYEDPSGSGAPRRLRAALEAPSPGASLPGGPWGGELAVAVSALAGRTVGLIGDHPIGFDPCGFTESDLARAGGVAVDRVDLDLLFAAAHDADPSGVLVAGMEGIDELDPGAVYRSLSLHSALDTMRTDRRWDAIALRCWPECFDDYGSAACTAQSLMSGAGIPATCEADVLGAATALALQEMTGGPAFVADLVDIDRTDGTVAFWHCGIAPAEMAHPDEPVAAAVHPNRGLPLINQFRLRPGRVIVSRISRRGVVWHTSGEILDRPRPYHGTSAVVRLDLDVDEFLAAVMSNGLEHHYVLAYV